MPGPLNRILELARLETGQYRLLLEYIGYRDDFMNWTNLRRLPLSWSVSQQGGPGGGLPASRLRRTHEITRETRGLLFCVQALIDALDLGESLKTYGLHFKMTHDDPRLYLIGHASLEKRGLSIGH
jgi:hypothetical protein